MLVASRLIPIQPIRSAARQSGRLQPLSPRPSSVGLSGVFTHHPRQGKACISSSEPKGLNTSSSRDGRESFARASCCTFKQAVIPRDSQRGATLKCCGTFRRHRAQNPAANESPALEGLLGRRCRQVPASTCPGRVRRPGGLQEPQPRHHRLRQPRRSRHPRPGP